MMIKKVFALFMVIVLCLSMCACKKDDTQTDPTTSDSTEHTEASKATENTENTKATEPVETTESTEPPETTESTEPPVAELSVADWQLEEPNYLSYEEYFSVEREFSYENAYVNTITNWIKGNHIYSFVKKDGNLVVNCYEIGGIYVVPDSSAYVKHKIAGADGHYGYLYNESQFLRIDLATGKAEVLLDGLNFKGASGFIGIKNINVYLPDNLVAYYTSYQNNELIFGRLYLPELKNEIVYKAQGEFYNIYLNRPETSRTIVWEIQNPEYVDFLKTELANPNSTIQKSDYYDYSELWKREDALSYILSSPMHIDHLENASNQRSRLKCTYDIENDKLTKQTGITDSCFHGSGMPHDHFNPDITTAPEPEVIMGQWMNLLNPLPDIVTAEETAADMIRLPGVDSKRYLYAKTDSEYKKLVDSPVSWSVDVGNGAIYISADKRSVFAVSYNDGQPVEIYRSSGADITATDWYGWSIDLEKQWLVILDGEIMVQIDLAAGKSRQLLRHQNIQSAYNIDYNQPTVYFEICAGLYGTGYTINMETGELRDHYRL